MQVDYDDVHSACTERELQAIARDAVIQVIPSGNVGMYESRCISLLDREALAAIQKRAGRCRRRGYLRVAKIAVRDYLQEREGFLQPIGEATILKGAPLRNPSRSISAIPVHS